MEKLRVFTAFSGYDSQCLALERLKRDYPGIDYELVGWSEIDSHAIEAHDALFPQWAEMNYGDISKIDWSQVPDFDLFTYSFPCFVQGTLVLTDKGYKAIESIGVGDKVMTHKGTFSEVEKTGKRLCDDIYRIKAMCFDELLCSGNHPFYVRKKGINGDKTFSEPQWVEAKDLTKGCYLGYAINGKNELPEWCGSVDNRWGHHRKVNKLGALLDEGCFWYVMGRYVGDGWKKNSQSGNGIVICCSDRNKGSLIGAIEQCGWNYTLSEERTVTKVIISMNELNDFVGRYGYYAHGKRIDAATMNLPENLLRSFIGGVIDSDGYIDGCGEYKVCTVSRELAYGLQQCVSKAYKCHVKMYFTKRRPTTKIEGRVVNQRDTYQIVWHTDKRKKDIAFYEDGYIWFPLKSTEKCVFSAFVYNMQVANEHTYTANGAIVHNCTDVSASGKQAGLAEGSGTRSSLLWECRRAIEVKKPRWLLMENVDALVSKKFIGYFQKWVDFLTGQGYASFSAVLNAKDYGVPQSRKRVFCVSIRDFDGEFHFPKPIGCERRLRDVLESEVDERFYLRDEVVENFLRNNARKKSEGNGFQFEPSTRGGYSKTVQTSAFRETSTWIDDNEQQDNTIR